ncbi:agamous-like MADS-box protein AGL62 [Oryza brachyantha]|uniref:agamous-like MADS-box protein AGL62 n=1 Tax=Oryza brachyantha TaxID=4533 RepID=UPI001AD9B827|nr:agamous-like MADS-box protein AGL62 [Oryza brachyantha]
MGRPRGGTSRGKQKIEIRFIEDKSRREVSFSKRRAGLFKKASELRVLCGASVAVLSVSMAGKVHAFGGPDVAAVLRRHALPPAAAAVAPRLLLPPPRSLVMAVATTAPGILPPPRPAASKAAARCCGGRRSRPR